MKKGKPASGRKDRFSVAALRELAGGKTFSRGKEYFEEGAVTLLSAEPARVLAIVEGGERYRVELSGAGATFDGSCTCPANDQYGFCKHQVAAALAANEAGEGAEPAGVLPSIREYLTAQPADRLVEMLLELASRDPALFQRLHGAATLEADPDRAADQIRRAIERATADDIYLNYDDAAAWNAELTAALDGVAALIAAGAGAAALELATEAIEGLEASMESIDDENGEGSALLGRACELHLQAALLARPDPLELARQLYEWETDSGFADFSGAVDDYAEVLGKAGLAEYRRLAEADWTKLGKREPAPPGREAYEAHDYGAQRVMGILDRLAEAEGDLEARIALRSKDLSTPRRHLDLAAFYLAHGREAEALRQAKEAVWLFEDRPPDEPLVRFLAERLAAAGRPAEAEKPLWRAFQHQPSRALYDALCRAGGPAAAERARARLAETGADERSRGWNSPNTLLAEIHKDEGRLAEAWALVRAGRVSHPVCEEMIAESGKDFPEDALAVLAAETERLIGVSAYDQAVALIQRMATLRRPAAQAAYLAALREGHHRKRKLLALLTRSGAE